MAKFRRAGRPRKPNAKRYPSGGVKHAAPPGPTPEALAHGGIVGCDNKTRPGVLGRLLRANLITEAEQQIGEAFRALVWSWRCQAGIRLPWVSWRELPWSLVLSEEEVVERWRKTTARLRTALCALYSLPHAVCAVVHRVVVDDEMPAHHRELYALQLGLTVLALSLPVR